MLAWWHVDIDQLHRQPGHENEEGQHREHTADGRVVARIVLVGEADRLTESIKLLQEFVRILLGHYITNSPLYNYYKI